MKKMYVIATMLLAAITLASGQKTKNSYQNVLEATNINIINCASINTPSVEFSPTYYLNGMVFVSSRRKNGMVDEKLGETFFELFYSDVDPNGKPLKPRSFSVEINSQLHEGPVTFNRQGDHMFFTRNNLQGTVGKADKKGTVRLKIYEANKGYYDWENIRELPFNVENYSCMHPTLSPDGMTLFFASDMPGGFGGRDIWLSEKKNGQWQKPINLGPEINTNKDDAFPFFHESGMLFFASDGHPGYGAMDIFMVDFTSNTWGAVTNLGKPFNSPKDDLGFIMDADGARGYLSSNRDGGIGSYDIYMFEAPDGLREFGVAVKPKLSTQVIVYDANTSRRTVDAVVRVFERDAKGIVENEDLYNIDLVPSSENPEDLVFKKVRKKEEEITAPKFLTNRAGEVLLQVEENQEYIILVSKAGFETQEVRYSTTNLQSGMTQPIEVAMKPSECVTLNGMAVSSTSKRPISSASVRVRNECDGSEMLLTTKMDGSFEYCLNMGCDYTITTEKLGYTKGFSEISTVKIRGSRSIEIELQMTPTAEEVFTGSLKKGTIIILDIYYDFDKSTIPSGEDLQMEALAKLMMQQPSMEIELIAHTDSRGDEAYNLALSLRRAESAKEFLVGRGIDAHRIRAFGYGEARLRNRCSDGVECSEEEHQYNRRTEVLVTKIDENISLNLNNKR